MGKEKVFAENVEDDKKKTMEFWEEIELQLERLEQLEKRYGSSIKDIDLDPFEDEKLVTSILEKRRNYRFLERSNMLKKRVSFFGIFSAGEDIEMIYTQYDFMKNQFNKIVN